MSNEVGRVAGHSVQAGEIHGDVHFHAEARVVPRQLPGAVRHFVNRSVEQDALSTLLAGARSEGVVLLSAIDGTAGVGKSSLAVHWAHRVRQRFADGELYVNLRGFDPVAEPVSPVDALGIFLVALGVSPERVPADGEARAAMFRSLVHGRRMLVLLDNARSAEQVRPLLPGSPACLVLVTSRNRLDELVVREGASRMTLQVLAERESWELLAGYLGRERLEAEPDAVGALISRCAGLPLALGIVAVSAAADPDFALAELVEELDDERERLDALDAGGETGVRAVFSWSYRSLPADAARMFRLMGLPTGQDLSLDAAAALAGLPKRKARPLLVELAQAHLVEQREGRYEFHDLLRAYASECAGADEAEEDRKAALRRLFDFYLRTSHAAEQQLIPFAKHFSGKVPDSNITGLSFEDDESAVEWLEGERANLIAALRQASKLDMHEYAWQITNALLYFFRLRGYVEDWMSTHETALESARQLGDTRAEAHLMLDLGAAYYTDKKYDVTVSLQAQALARFQELNDPFWEGIAHLSLGEAFTLMDRYDEAMASLQRALELALRLEDRYVQGATHSAIGKVHSRAQEFEAARERTELALSLFREVDNKHGEGVVMHDLAEIHRDAGQLDEAVRTYRSAVEFRRSIGHKPGEATSLRGLGTALRTVGDLDGARDAWQQALAVLGEIDGTEIDEVHADLDELDR